MAVLCQTRLLFQENNTYYIPNWDKYQSEDRLEKIREQNRIRKRNQRQREQERELEQQQMSRDTHVNVPTQNKKENKNNYNKL